MPSSATGLSSWTRPGIPRRSEGVPIDLTAKEFALLRYFLLHPDEVISAEQLLEHVWDEHADPFTNTVRVTFSNLRRKLAASGAGEVIDTVVGAGYRLARWLTVS